MEEKNRMMMKLKHRWFTGIFVIAYDLYLIIFVSVSWIPTIQSLIPILYESDQLLVINKPPGIAHHNAIQPIIKDENNEDDNHDNEDEDADTTELGVISLLKKQTGYSKLYGVHRLDRVTSGILVIAKTPHMAAELTQKFESQQVTKYYLGISAKKIKSNKPQYGKKKQGWIQGYMERSRNKSWILTRGQSRTSAIQQSSNRTQSNTNSSTTAKNKNSKNRNKNKENKDRNFAVTRFFTAGLGHLYPASPQQDERSDDVDSDSDSDSDDHNDDVNDKVADKSNNSSSSSSNSNNNNSNSASGIRGKTLLLFRPLTGKTHQLRVAAKSIGLPLLGDPIYRDGVSTSTSTSTSSSSNYYYRTCLHAMILHIDHVRYHGTTHSQPSSSSYSPSSTTRTTDNKSAIHDSHDDDDDDDDDSNTNHDGHPLTIFCPPPFEDLFLDGSWDSRRKRTSDYHSTNKDHTNQHPNRIRIDHPSIEVPCRKWDKTVHALIQKHVPEESIRSVVDAYYHEKHTFGNG